MGAPDGGKAVAQDSLGVRRVNYKVGVLLSHFSISELQSGCPFVSCCPHGQSNP
jgi:hypothetical protein